MANEKISSGNKQHISRVEVYWHTVRYRTVVLYVLGITTIVLATTYLVFPDMSARVLQKLSDAVGKQDSGVATISARQARFVNLDGHVQVKKVNSVQWVNADYQITLDKGDLIQTDPEGVARLAFADGTTYTVKGDTLVTVEENIVQQDQATQVAVHISSGPSGLGNGHLAGGGIDGAGFLRECGGFGAGKQPFGGAQRSEDEPARRDRGYRSSGTQPGQRACGHRAIRARYSSSRRRGDRKVAGAGAAETDRAAEFAADHPGGYEEGSGAVLLESGGHWPRCMIFRPAPRRCSITS